jgi:undecaprenyl diphosphate synthase
MDAVPDAAPLRHIIVVGGTVAEWAAVNDDGWADRLDELGKVADHVGANWLTLRPYTGGAAPEDVPERAVTVGNCLVVAHPQADGRARVAEAVNALQSAGASITESAIANLLNAPAGTDPDLVVVLGDGDRLPPSLVWELAYSELVFIPTAWAQFGAAHLEAAINSFAHRHRRFGGVDDD